MTNTKQQNEKRLKEILNEKIDSYNRAPNIHKHDELVEKWGLCCDCDACAGTTGEAPYGV